MKSSLRNECRRKKNESRVLAVVSAFCLGGVLVALKELLWEKQLLP